MDGEGERLLLVERDVAALAEDARDELRLWEESEEPTSDDMEDDDNEDVCPLLARYDLKRLLRGFSLASIAPGATSTLRMVTPDPPVALRLIDTLDPPPTTVDLGEPEVGVVDGMVLRERRVCSCWMVRGVVIFKAADDGGSP